MLTTTMPWAVSVALLALAACQSPALLRTARTLPAGGNDLSLSFNLSHVSAKVAGVPDDIESGVPSSFNYPNLIADILYSHGVSNDFELGRARSLGSGLFELNTKLRYLETPQGRVHAALAPVIGYRVLGIVLEYLAPPETIAPSRVALDGSKTNVSRDDIQRSARSFAPSALYLIRAQ